MTRSVLGAGLVLVVGFFAAMGFGAYLIETPKVAAKQCRVVALEGAMRRAEVRERFLQGSAHHIIGELERELGEVAVRAQTECVDPDDVTALLGNLRLLRDSLDASADNPALIE